MKFLTGLTKFITWAIFLLAVFYWFAGADANLKTLAVLVFFTCAIVLIIIQRSEKSKLPGGIRGSVIQGVWVLEKHFRFDPMFKKYESLPVEPKKNYFEFKGNNFRSGDLDEKGRQLSAEYSPFSINGNEIILESDFFKQANWKWEIKKGKLELTGETTQPKYSKSLFVFFRKNRAAQ